jgi:AraC-like DNA-binding protein
VIRSDVGRPRGLIGVARGDDPRVEHVRRAPPPSLREHIAHFWMVRWTLDAPLDVETLPHPTVHVTVENGRGLVGGVNRGKFSRRLAGHGRVFGVKWRPAMFQPLLQAAIGGGMAKLTDRTTTIGSIFGSAGRKWANDIENESDESRLMALAEAFFAARFPAIDPLAIEVRDLVERLERDRELLRVEDLAALSGRDVRQLQRLFRRYVGVTPKWVIGRYRLHEAAALLDGKRVKIGDVAQALGYFDQAHFVRDFKAVVGRAPSDEARATGERRRKKTKRQSAGLAATRAGHTKP